MRAVLFVLLILIHDPPTQPSSSVRPATVSSSSGVDRQTEQAASYRVSKVTVEGANALSTEQIVNLSKLRVGQIVNQQIIAKAHDAILRAYANRGRINARVRIDSESREAVPGAKLGDLSLRIEIVEGDVFVLRRLEFVGNATTRDQIVRRRVLQQEGEPYSQELLEKSLNRLNALRRFEKLTMAAFERRVDEKERCVDLVVHLKEIKRDGIRR